MSILTMKFEELLMMQHQSGEEKQAAKFQLEEQVEKLQQELDEELQVKRVLQCAMQGPLGCCDSCSSLSPMLPLKVQVLLAELAVAEAEIDWLETRINELKLDVCQEQRRIKECEITQMKKGLLQLQLPRDPRQLRKYPSRRPNLTDQQHKEYCESSQSMTSQNHEQRRRYITARDRRASVGSSMEFAGIYEMEEDDGEGCNKPRSSVGHATIPKQMNTTEGEMGMSPNKLSEELIKCLIGIFLNLNKATYKRNKGSTNLPKNALTCMNSKVLVSKPKFSCATPIFPVNHNTSHLDPYGVVLEPDFIIRDVGPYKNFVQMTRSSLDSSRLTECFQAMRRLRGLMQKLNRANIGQLTHKQKLAFWINVYNASIMNAFLRQGLPSTQEKPLTPVNEATINVGGAIFKASTIAHYILRHPTETKHGLADEKEMLLLRHSHGLAYPEPNVIFALCRGSWSSPALRLFTADEVMNELEKAKVEYLEASVGLTSKRKILVPKLMQLHMKDFADDLVSLLEWVYSQLPYTSSLKRLMMECLTEDGGGDRESSSFQKLVEIFIQPYGSDFRYLIAAM